MLDKTWVPQRKRKLIPSVVDVHTGKEEASYSADCTNKRSSKIFKDESDASRYSEKIKGHDGYYFECEECDLGGNLLCCDSCPRTYHLECLNPPLKRAPSGKWKCPKCCNQFDKALSSSETSSKRARSKMTKKSMAVHGLSNSNKESHLGRSFLASCKSRRKEKASPLHVTASVEKKSSSSHLDMSSSMKSSFSDDNVLRNGELSTASCKKINKRTASSPHQKISAHKAVRTLENSMNLDASNKLPKDKPDLYGRENRGKKFKMPLVVPSQITKKKRKRINKIGKEISKSFNGNHASSVSNCLDGEVSLCPESAGSLPNCKSSEHLSSLSNVKQEMGLLKSLRLKGPKIGHQEFSLPPGLIGHLENDKRNTHQEVSHDNQQVDRILGCRIQINISETTSPVISQAEVGQHQTEFRTCDLISQENHDQPDGCFDANKAVDMDLKNAIYEPYCGVPDVITHKIDGDLFNELHKDIKGKTCRASGNFDMTEEQLSSSLQSTQDNCMTDEGNELGDDLTRDAKVGENSSKKVFDRGINVELLTAENYGERLLSRGSDLSGTNEIDHGNAATMGSKCDHRSETVAVSQSMQELRLKDSDSVSHEFFVKWAGKSNIHNSWITEDKLKVLAKRKLENYKAKYGTAIINICEEQWYKPQRIIALHEFENGDGKAFVKWHGLPYDECTWERLDEPVIRNSSHLILELKHFESQTLVKDCSDEFAKRDIHEVVPLVEQPKELKGGSLFPHQLEALNWLRKCWNKSKNVILADEMGLGKTVSACSFISSLYFEFKVKLPCLVLVPLSTMPNWLAEFSSWAPHLNVVEYHGCAKARSVIRQFEWHANNADRPTKLTKAYKFNVLLTTYEMILADSCYLRGVSWEVLIVDEGHRLKNSESKLFSLLNTFSFQHRVLLTGTPLQNNLGEMYNLLNFLQPSSFPSLASFEEKFNDLSTAGKVEELKKLVSPHMLRRLKKDAMQNIPPKTERMVPVELTSIQAEYYRAMLTKNYQILRNIGKGVAQQSMLNIVMQLRKVCNHPYLIPGTEPESGSAEFLQEMRIKASAKLNLLHSMLKIMHKEGHRILIFSQMTKLLDILEDYLTAEFGQGTFERVDGSVSVADRQAAIARFNRDKTRFVFLLSTRSCGLGINLASADTVIIYDSDFNPHADIQAMNRAHRIGQSNRLLVYRLVVRASVEERILQLAKKKLMLDQLFVNKSGSQKEVEDILRWGTEELFSSFEGENVQNVKNHCIQRVDATADGDYKNRRRGGGLGDVYKDKCTDGGTGIVWDECAISKLLDRSNLLSGHSENMDNDLENDLLGSVKSLDWNEEPVNEDPSGSEMLTNLVGRGLNFHLTRRKKIQILSWRKMNGIGFCGSDGKNISWRRKQFLAEENA
ncbi:hypothetical protein HPP92_015113 [Vanilla planifolia]|uniref:Protein CHROMATIN REMODELING 4 n=1 Tax=Vanilla planifolia TaxID=51239 RepID=A0A835QV91_VANPL|nr:hypothetical protein HPP92_015113 [Vanilla planifolia]